LEAAAFAKPTVALAAHLNGASGNFGLLRNNWVNRLKLR